MPTPTETAAPVNRTADDARYRPLPGDRYVDPVAEVDQIVLAIEGATVHVIYATGGYDDVPRGVWELCPEGAYFVPGRGDITPLEIAHVLRAWVF